MPNDIQGELRQDQYLTDFSERFTQDPSVFITPVAVSNVPVLLPSDKYVRYDRGYFWRDEAQVRPLGGRPVQVGYKVEPGNYNCEEWALEHTIDDRQRKNVAAERQINLDENATTLLTGKQLIRSDRMWCEKFFTTGVWTHDVVAYDDFIPFNDTDSDPIDEIGKLIDIMAESTGKAPNVLVLGATAYRALRRNPAIRDTIKYTNGRVPNEAILASLFEVEKVAVARAVYNAAAEGATNDFTFIAAKDAAWLGYIDPNPSLDSATAIARFSWTGLVPGANQYGGVMERGRDDRAHSDYFQNRTAFGLEVVSPDLGIFIPNATVAPSDIQ